MWHEAYRPQLKALEEVLQGCNPQANRNSKPAPLSLFESGAILEYLAEKSGLFIPSDLRGRWECLQWLYWQMAGLGPMAGQTHHFRLYAQEKIPYAIDRYVTETNRLYGVLDRQLATTRESGGYIAGALSIADMAAYPWIVPWKQPPSGSSTRRSKPLAASPVSKSTQSKGRFPRNWL